MCLQINKTIPPDSEAEGTAYKFLIKSGSELRSPSEYQYIWDEIEWNRACDDLDDDDPNVNGLHTYLTKEDAIKGAATWKDIQQFSAYDYVIVTLQVRNRLAVGTITKCDYNSNGKPGEIWKEAKILKMESYQNISNKQK